MKSVFIILILLVTALAMACNQRQLLQPDPPLSAPRIQRPLPLRAVFYISEKTKNLSYQSPEYIPWVVRPNLEILRPFEIPVGQLFAKAAIKSFSGVFQTVTVIDNLPAAGTYPLLVEPHLENITLDLVYYPSDARPPHNQLLDVGGALEAGLRLSGQGQPEWQKSYRVAIPTQRILVNPWTGEQIARMVADAIASLVGAMTLEMTTETDKPAVPLDQWLKSLPRE